LLSLNENLANRKMRIKLLTIFCSAKSRHFAISRM